MTQIRHRSTTEAAKGARTAADKHGDSAGQAAVSAHDFRGKPSTKDSPTGQVASVGPVASPKGAGAVTADIRLLTEDDWEVRKELTLRSVAAEPEKTVLTLAKAEARLEQDWRDSITRSTSTFVAELDSKPVGRLGAFPTERPGVQEIGSVWIAPEARRQGVGHQLMQTQLQWLNEHGCQRVVLWTLKDNIPMLRLAEQHRFTLTGSTEFHTSQDVPSVEMVLELT